jgi:hypothetical protein
MQNLMLDELLFNSIMNARCSLLYIVLLPIYRGNLRSCLFHNDVSSHSPFKTISVMGIIIVTERPSHSAKAARIDAFLHKIIRR